MYWELHYSVITKLHLFQIMQKHYCEITQLNDKKMKIIILICKYFQEYNQEADKYVAATIFQPNVSSQL